MVVTWAPGSYGTKMRKASIIRVSPAEIVSAMNPTSTEHKHASLASSANEREILLTLFDLGREVASTLDLDDLLRKFPSSSSA